MPPYLQHFLENLSTFQYALIAGPLIAATCSLLSVFVVLRRMAMISDGVSHSGFGGISLAILAGYYFAWTDTELGRECITGLFCVGAALLIGYLSRAKKVSEDSSIGIVLVATMALGTLLLSVRKTLGHLKPGQSLSIETLLFGDINAVSRTDAIVMIVVALLVFATVFLLYHEFVYTTLDEEMARINGVAVRAIHTLLLVMVSLVIVVAVRMVGFLLITALMIIPGATATMLSRRFAGVILRSLLVGILGMVFALLLATNPPFSSYPSGPIIVLTLFLIFAAVWFFRHQFKPKILSDEP